MQGNTINIKADKYSSHSNTNLFIILSKRHSLYNMYLETTVTNPHSNQYKVISIISDIARHRLFKPAHWKNQKDLLYQQRSRCLQRRQYSLS